MSSTRLWVRISNCSRDFLSTCGERSTVNFSILVGSGMGPRTRAPVRLAVLTISLVDWSSTRWSYALRRIRMFWLSIVLVLAHRRGLDRFSSFVVAGLDQAIHALTPVHTLPHPRTAFAAWMAG